MNESDSAGKPKPAQLAQQPQPTLSPASDPGPASVAHQVSDGENVAPGEEELSPHINVARQNAMIKKGYQQYLEEPLPDTILSWVKKLENKESNQ